MVVSDQNEHHHCHGTDTTETDGSCRSKCFDNFVQAQTCHQTFSTFHALCQAIDIEYPPAQSSCDHITFYPRLKKQLGDSWRAQSLWGKLDKRFYGKEYFFNSKMNRPGGTRIGEDTKILIIGAGPCGLRTAIEMACLGAKTIVVEKRDVFSRNNVLHLWPFIITDLKALGAKKFYGRFCAGAIDHISIRQLQLILLKTSLLLGVEVVVNVSFESLSIPSDPVICDDGTVHQKGWTASVKPSDHPLAKYEFDVIVGADGKRNTLQGFKRKEFRGKLAIGLTANFINRNTSAEAKVEEISGVAYIFNQEFFKNLRRTTHIDLENIVYYKGETHYFVMTAKKHSLIAKGVLRQDYDDTKSLLCYQNVDQQALTLYAMEAADFSTNHKLPNLEFAINQYGEPDVALFDFTCMYAAENAGLFREIKGQKLLSSLVGDSLLEPFWPMGTGCARGFFAAFDLVWMTRRWCLLTQSSNDNQTAVEKGNSIELEVLAERESIYRLLHHTTPQNTVKKWANYTIDPNTRYPNLNLKMVSTKQVAPLYLSDQHHGDEAQEQEKTSNQNGPATSHAESRRPLNSALTRKVSIIRSNKLMTWCRRITENYEAVHITDMSSSWRSGLALCAIIHQFRPDLIKWEELHPIDIEVNNQLAFDLAEKHFGISPVMTGKEMATCDEVDKLVMVTYISQFYEVFKNEKPVGAVAIKNSGDSLETPGAQGGPKSPLSSTSPVGLLIRFTNHIKRKSVNGKHEEQVKKKKYGGLFRRKSSSSAPEAIPEDENKENESKDDPKAQSSVMQIGGAEVRLRSKKGAQSQEGSVRVPGVNQRASDRISALSSQLMSQFVQNGALREMPASDKCYFCQKRVYIAERMSAEGLFFHSKCFVCCHCGITLRRGNYEYVSETGKFYCRAHYFAHSDMFKQAGSKAGRKKYGADGMDSASTNAPGLTDTLRNEEVKPTEKFLTPERIELANIRMSMLNHPEELSEEAQTQHNLSGLQQGKNSPIQEDDFMSESSDEDVDWEAVLKEANEQGRNDPDESDLDTDDERADDSLISQSSSRELYSTSVASSLEGSDNDQVKTRRSLSSSSSATDSLVDPDPAAKYGELRANSQTAPVGMETVGTGFFSPEKSNVNIAEVETEQKTKEDDAEEKSDELSSLSTASPSNIPDVSMSEPDSDDETPARVEPEVGEEPKDPPEISAESQTGEKAISDVPSAPPARKPRTIFNLLSSPVEPEQPALSSATPYQEETVSEEVSELELPKRVRSSKDMRRLDTLDRVQQYLLQNPMDIDYERSQDKEDDALSTASSATSTSDLNTAQFDVEDLLEDNSNNKSSLPLSASVVARSAAIGSTTNATSSNQARPLPRPVSIQGVHVGASASTARNNTSVWSNLADDTTSSEVEPPSGGDRGKSFSESYISSYRPGQESWSDEHEKRPKPPAPERSTSYDSLELRMKMRLKARNQWFQQESDQAMQLKRATSENSDQDEERVSSERCEAPSSPAGASWQTASDIELVGEQSLLAYTPATPSAPLAASLDSDNDQFFTPIAKTPVRPQQDKDISTPLSARSPPQLGNLTMSTTHDTTGDFVSPQGTPSTVPRRLPSVPSTTNRRSLPALPTVPHLEALSPTWQSPQTKPSVEEELRTREMRVKERVAKMKAQTAKKRNSMSSKSESNRTSSSFDDAEVGVGKKSQSSASDDVTAAANPTGQVEPTYSGVSPKPKRRTSFRQKLRKMHKRKEESNDPSSKVKRTLPVPNAAPQRTRESASPVEMAHSDADKKKKKKIKIKKTKGKTVSSRTESSADSGDLRKSSPGKSAKALFRMSPSKKDRKLVGNSTFYDGESTLERKYKTDSDRERAILRGERVRFLPDVPDSAHTSRDRQDSYDSIEKDATLTKQPRRKRRSTLAGYTPEQIEAKITRRVQIAARRQAKMEAQKRLRRAQVIQRQLEEVEVKQRELEERGVRLEKLLREEGERKSREESASMQEWFQLVQEKNALLRYENELMIYQRELQLEDVQSHLQQELRERMAMEDKRKTSAQLAQEKEILQKMLEVVEQRDELVGLLEEQRIKEKVEMVDIETLMLSKFNTFSNQDQSADASSDSVTSSPRSAPVSS